jgi:RNA polymerase-binding protein DksA
MTDAAGSPRAGVKDEIRRRLVEQRRALLRTLTTTDEELALFDAEETGERGRRDAALAGTAGAVLSRLSGQERHELDEIDDALSRLEAGAYGLCERCARAIALARLEAMPAARYCLECQRREEAQG